LSLAVGQFLFQHRSVTPIPILVFGIICREEPYLIAILFLIVGELIRLSAVAIIGGISRTRDDSVGPLCTEGIFSISRNPLYVGNLLLWSGFLLLCGNLVIMMCSLIFLCLQYHAIIQWEESMLLNAHKERYIEYCQETSRYISLSSYRPVTSKGVVPILRTERGTLLAITAGVAMIGWLQCI